MSDYMFKRVYVEHDNMLGKQLCELVQRTVRRDRVFLAAHCGKEHVHVVLHEPQIRKLRDDLTSWLNGERWGDKPGERPDES